MEIVKSNSKYYLGKYSAKHYKMFESCIIDMLNSGATIKLGDLSINSSYAQKKQFAVMDYQYNIIREFDTFRGAWIFIESKS